MQTSSSLFAPNNKNLYVDHWIDGSSNFLGDNIINNKKQNSSSIFSNNFDLTSRPNTSRSSFSTSLFILKDKTNISINGSDYSSVRRKVRDSDPIEKIQKQYVIETTHATEPEQSIINYNKDEKQQVFYDLTKLHLKCKHSIIGLSSNNNLTYATNCNLNSASNSATRSSDLKAMVFLPRCFQHHQMKKWMKERYSDQGYILKKNYKCPPSACDIYPQPSNGNINQNNYNLLSYRYLRYHSGNNDSNRKAKELLCRFCHGTNWLSCESYFKHLFYAHGIMSEVNRSTYANEYSNIMYIEQIRTSEYLTCFKQNLNLKEFSRNVFSIVETKLVPEPLKFYSTTINGGFKRIHALCPHCSNWIRLGWCEHDKIMNEEEIYLQNVNTIRNLTNSYYDIFNEGSNMSYIQNRERSRIEGLYENYFRHYIECNYGRFQNRCLYIDIKLS